MKILLDHSITKNYNMSIKLYANSNILVIGSSGSGKTTAVLKIIEEKLIEPMPKKIIYLYRAHQPFMDDMTNIEFVKGLDLSVINNYNGPKLLIIDDLILELNKELANHFIAGSHHKQTTTIFITHSLYLNNELYRLISNNSQHILEKPVGDFSIVVNAAPSNQAGSHWLALLYKSKKWYFLDSYGRTLIDDTFSNSFVKAIKNYIGGKLVYNKQWL